MVSPRLEHGYVLVGGWPGSGKTTLSQALAHELGASYLGKDEIKGTLMDAIGAPASVEEAQRLGRIASDVLLQVAPECPAAVLDGTWFARSRAAVDALSGPKVEVRCVVPVEVARRRFHARVRDPRHLDDARDESELWGAPVLPLGVGPLVEVDTAAPVDVVEVARQVLDGMSGERR